MVAQAEIDNIQKFWRHVFGGGHGLVQVFTGAGAGDPTPSLPRRTRCSPMSAHCPGGLGALTGGRAPGPTWFGG